jgi:hypothetical protein
MEVDRHASKVEFFQSLSFPKQSQVEAKKVHIVGKSLGRMCIRSFSVLLIRRMQFVPANHLSH